MVHSRSPSVRYGTGAGGVANVWLAGPRQSRCLGSRSVSVRAPKVRGEVETFHDIIAHLATNTHYPHPGASDATLVLAQPGAAGIDRSLFGVL